MSAEALRTPAQDPTMAGHHRPATVGGLAARAELRLMHSETLAAAFDPIEIDVVSAISEGQTMAQTTRQLVDYLPADIKNAKTSAMQKLKTNSTAVLVDRSIRLGLVPIEVKPDEEALARVTDLDRRMLGLYARGVSNHRIAKDGKLDLRSVETYHDGLLERVGAWSRAHAIRRSYELGIREVKPLPRRALTR